jgi:hypothetical protein
MTAVDLDAEPDAWLAAFEDLKEIGELHAAYAAGREAEGTERDQAWNRIAGQVSRSGKFADVERRRWTVRGEQRTREDFGRPHPDDFKGRDGAT